MLRYRRLPSNQLERTVDPWRQRLYELQAGPKLLLSEKCSDSPGTEQVSGQVTSFVLIAVSVVANFTILMFLYGVGPGVTMKDGP